MEDVGRYSCFDCQGTGIVLMMLKERTTEGPYAFKCECAMGTRRGANYPLWKFANKKLYENARKGVDFG